jgi:outer membrane biosynthesis protein TonB
LLLSDTILVTKEAVETLTKSKKKFSEISYSISAAPAKPAKAVKEEAKSDEDEDEPSEESADEPRVKKPRATEEAGHRPSLRHRDPKDVATTAVDEKRKANQARLAELQAKQARERYLKEKNKGGDEDDKQDNSLANKDYTSYKSHSEYPLSADREKVTDRGEHHNRC